MVEAEPGNTKEKKFNYLIAVLRGAQELFANTDTISLIIMEKTRSDNFG